MPAFGFYANSRRLRGSKLTCTLAPSARSQIPPLQITFPKLTLQDKYTEGRLYNRPRVPAKISTVSLVGRRDKSRSAPSVLTDEDGEQTYASLEECIDSRPPLPLDLSGPKPTTYDPPTTLPWETQSPSFTMRPKTQPEKESGGDRVAWNKQWIASPDIWTYRVDFDDRVTWPSPAHYEAKASIGQTQITLPQSPSHSMGKRRAFILSKKGAGEEPSPDQYNHDISKILILRKYPSYTIQQGRRGGTMVWTAKEPVPGPGWYNPRAYRASSKRCAPCFSMARGERTIGITRNCTL